MNAREIKKSHVSVSGYFSSYKNNRLINYESKLESDFYLLLEFDENIQSYVEQPFSIFYNFEERSTRYTPDTLVNYKDGSQKVFEVKPKDKIKSNVELQNKLKLQTSQVKKEKKLELCIFTDEDIDKIYINNLKFIYNFAFLDNNEIVKNKIVDRLMKISDKITINEFLELICNDKNDKLVFLPYLWNIVFHNTKLINLYEKLNMTSYIDPKGLECQE